MAQQVSPAVVIVVLILVLAIVVALYYLVVQSSTAEEGGAAGVSVGPAGPDQGVVAQRRPAFAAGRSPGQF